ncbi:MAG: disulfide bond formation protein B [Exilibacterium sp.]
MPSIRQTNLILFLGCCGLILTALYMQEFMKMIPCALCITQRVFVIAVGLVALVAWLHNPSVLGRRLYAGLGIITGIIGAGFSARHLWLQSLPEDLKPACGPSLEYIIDTFPLMEALDVLLAGDGNCAEVSWTFLGVSIPGWTLVAFVGLVATNLWQLVRQPPRWG